MVKKKECSPWFHPILDVFFLLPTNILLYIRMGKSSRRYTSNIYRPVPFTSKYSETRWKLVDWRLMSSSNSSIQGPKLETLAACHRWEPRNIGQCFKRTVCFVRTLSTFTGFSLNDQTISIYGFTRREWSTNKCMSGYNWLVLIFDV